MKTVRRQGYGKKKINKGQIISNIVEGKKKIKMRGKENMRRREEEDERKWDDKERDNGRNIEGNVERKEETRYSVIMKQKKIE